MTSPESAFVLGAELIIDGGMATLRGLHRVESQLADEHAVKYSTYGQSNRPASSQSHLTTRVWKPRFIAAWIRL